MASWPCGFHPSNANERAALQLFRALKSNSASMSATRALFDKILTNSRYIATEFTRWVDSGIYAVDPRFRWPLWFAALSNSKTFGGLFCAKLNHVAAHGCSESWNCKYRDSHGCVICVAFGHKDFSQKSIHSPWSVHCKTMAKIKQELEAQFLTIESFDMMFELFFQSTKDERLKLLGRKSKYGQEFSVKPQKSNRIHQSFNSEVYAIEAGR
eukprot:TRINITY_DN6842_c0_g1_i2.p1 TRINITY_DN6842_c0_g1~~TRINITY_DN6842_c0_g1_i2.p1  ORF type:complete len:212 (-),score=32.52 TRINITY_DN6842_c0_g1_i2:38-673(-)